MDKGEQARSEIATYGVITVRTLKVNEAMPKHLGSGFEQMQVMKGYVWVAEKNGKIVGLLMATPCHGLIFVVRLRVEKTAPPMTVWLLFRKCVRDCKERGFEWYFTYLDTNLDAERKLAAICQKTGGMRMMSMPIGIVGRLEKVRGR